MSSPDVPDRTYTADEVDAAVNALRRPGRLDHAQAVVGHAAPSLQQVLVEALEQGGWFAAHEAEIARATGEEDPAERRRSVRMLLAEETRLGMLVGVAVGFELARELDSLDGAPAPLPSDPPAP